MSVRVPLERSRAARHAWQFAIAAVFAFAVLSGPVTSHNSLAKGPPLATTILPASVLDAPAIDATVIAILPAGSEVELTGSAAPGYLQVYYAGTPAWVPAQYLALSDRPGIDTAVAIEDLPLLEEPRRDAGVLAVVPEGETVILTGASLDGYDAASHEGVGGWLNERGLAQ